MSEKDDQEVNAYLSFRLGEEFFAIHVDRVHKIMEVSKITGIPKSPDYMKGVINLRGTVLPVIDTRVKFGMQPVEQTKSSSILVIDVRIGNKMVKTGLLVDAVQAVENLEEEDLLPPPDIGDRYKANFISYMAKVKDKFYIVLDIDAVFSVDEQIDISNISKAGEQIIENGQSGGKQE